MALTPTFDYTRYYLNQAGYGIGPVFQGQRFQHGYGLGGFFASLFRSAVLMLKRGAKVAGGALLRTGLDVASDALAGGNIKECTTTVSTDRSQPRHASSRSPQSSSGFRTIGLQTPSSTYYTQTRNKCG